MPIHGIWQGRRSHYDNGVAISLIHVAPEETRGRQAVACKELNSLVSNLTCVSVITESVLHRHHDPRKNLGHDTHRLEVRGHYFRHVHLLIVVGVEDSNVIRLGRCLRGGFRQR